ncbi:MAG: apolipoprotein N-acyltransferase [Deltaproteobacteria bacterium]|nr:apolipoprotein N-acyltransferase [Deltaproteobacteria bacterium]
MPAAVIATALALGLFGRMEWQWVPLGWVALVPWLAALDRVRSWRAALAAGLLMTVAFVWVILGWFAGAIENYTGAPAVVGLLVLLLLSPLMQPQFVPFVFARHLAQRRHSGRWRTALTGACVYVGVEWALPKLFADSLGHGLYGSKLMRQAADIAGVHGLSFLLIIANECVLAAIAALAPDKTKFSARWRHACAPASAVAVLVLGLLAYGAVRYEQLRDHAPPSQRITAGIVQADISRYGQLAADLGTYDAVRMILDAHFALSATALESRPLDLLVWPETVYPTTFGSPKSADGADFDREIGAFVAAAGIPLVFGSYDGDETGEFNAAVFLEPAADGRLDFETYRKVQLFPLTEYVPRWLDYAPVRGWLPWLGSWKAGPGPRAIPLSLRDRRSLRIAPLICYEDLDPGHVIAAVRQGAELIVTLSNDSWFAVGEGPRFHLMVSAFRSIETRRPQLRATNTGISAVITPTGELLSTLGVHERSHLTATVTPASGATTLMLAWGDWFGSTALVCGLALLGAPAWRPRAAFFR